MAGNRPAFSLLSVVSNIERHKIASDQPFTLLMDLAWPPNALPSAQTHVRFARELDPITFDANDGLGPQSYTPFNFAIGDLKVGSDGSVPDCEVVASNVLLALQQTIEQYAGVVGASLNLYVVNAANPLGEPELSLSFTVKQTTSDAKLVHFKLGASSPLRRLFPIYMYRPNFCVLRYKGLQCGYTGSMPSCSHTIDGATGCIAHNNLVRILTFPGIDTNGAAVASVA